MDLSIDIEFGPVIPVTVATQDEPAPGNLAAVAVVGGGTFAAGTYYWVVTGTDSYGETTASNEANAVIALNGSATLTWGALPAGTTGVKVYRGTAAGAENALIATLGAVVAYTDTGTAGSAATPPVANTAQIGSVLVIAKDAHLIGYSLTETGGVNPVAANINCPGNLIVPLNIAKGATEKEWFGPEGIFARGGIIIAVTSGVYSGVVYLRYWE